MAEYVKSGGASAGKTYLHKKELLSDSDPDDKTVVSATVRKYDYGGVTAEFSVESPNGGMFSSSNGFRLYCDPGNPQSLKQLEEKVKHLKYCLDEFWKASKEASKEG